MNKDKIEGAYVLMKRFKNRLKGLDEVIRQISEDKVSQAELKAVTVNVSNANVRSMFNDMKHLFDTTVEQFDKKVAFERQKVAKSYESILEKQRNMILSFEMKYNNMIRSRIDTHENALADL